MTLLITLFSAVISTVVWYKKAPCDTFKISTLCYLYWGASLMWLVDAVSEYIELGADFFTPFLNDMLNDTFLGLSVTVFALVIWVVRLLISDPENVIKTILVKK